MQKDGPPEFTIENATITFLNFSGRPDRYNNEGDMNFSIVLDDDLAKELFDQGWPVKQKENEETGELYPPTLQVAVAYNKYPPSIWLIRETSKGARKLLLDKESVGILDVIEKSCVDMTVRGYMWTVNDKSGIKGYLKEMYVTAYQTGLDAKYEEIPEG